MAEGLFLFGEKYGGEEKSEVRSQIEEVRAGEWDGVLLVAVGPAADNFFGRGRWSEKT